MRNLGRTAPVPPGMIDQLMWLLIGILILGALLAIVWWAINQVQMAPPFRIAAVLVFVVICLLLALKLLHGGLAHTGSGCF